MSPLWKLSAHAIPNRMYMWHQYFQCLSVRQILQKRNILIYIMKREHDRGNSKDSFTSAHNIFIYIELVPKMWKYLTLHTQHDQYCVIWFLTTSLLTWEFYLCNWIVLIPSQYELQITKYSNIFKPQMRDGLCLTDLVTLNSSIKVISVLVNNSKVVACLSTMRIKMQRKLVHYNSLQSRSIQLIIPISQP